MNDVNNTIAGIKEDYDLRTEIEKNLGSPVRYQRDWSIWRCPFHDERTTGAFVVYRNSYKCYSCGAHGDVFDWWSFWTNKPLSELLKDHTLPPEQELERRQKSAEQSIKRLETEIEEAKRVLEELRSAHKWIEYHNNLNSENRKLWNERGVPDWYIDYMKLGINLDRIVWYNDKEYHTPSLTIPFYDIGWECVNLKHRLINPPADGYKYAYEKKGIPSQLFIAEPDMTSMKGRTLLLEGEIKAAVTMCAADDPVLQVIGLPGKTPKLEMLDKLGECDPIYICLDPDAYFYAGLDTAKDKRPAIIRILDALGRERCRVIKLPDKVDNMLNNMTGNKKTWLKNLMAQARRI